MRTDGSVESADSGARVPESWNDTAQRWDAPAELRALIRPHLVSADTSPALRFEGSSLSFAELGARVGRLARHLRAAGVGRDVLVGIAAERSFELVEAILATVVAGGAYVPMDPGYPEERLRFMLEDSQVPVLLTQEALLERLPQAPGEVICLDRDRAAIDAHEAAWPECEISPEDLAYVIYTSGSTGKPKGAMNTHRAIANRLLWMQQRYGLTRADVVAQKTPFSFDVSVWEFFWPFVAGARLAVARPEGHKDARYLADWIESEGVSVIHYVPSMLHVFLEERGLRDRCRSLRHVICSGEAMTAPLQNRFFDALDAGLHNLYGPTEAAVDVTHWSCERGGTDPVVPIGRPIANTRMYVLDADDAETPVGETGELCIAGVQVGRGYWNREDLTRERFVPDPFAGEPDARMYRTGDLARWRPDGTLEFLGRIDHQVKIRGNRIELGEIEASLEGLPEVAQAVVLAREDLPGHKRLVAYVTAADAGAPLAAALRGALAARLPDYMVPSATVVLEKLPLLPNGKVDRSALPAPGTERPELDRPYTAPRGALEKHLAALWAEIIQVDRVGRDDPFFDLGGTSLLAAQFIRSLERELGQNIYVVSVFDAPTVAGYAAFLERDYADALAGRFAPSRATSAATRAHAVDDDAVSRMHAATPLLTSPAPIEPEASPNPSAGFVLAPPRSGTTLLRVMLAGHPGVFAAAELQLLCFHDLAARSEAFQGKFSLWREGTLRALMEADGCDAVAAEETMARLEAQGTTTRQFYRELQRRIGERLLVDKSPGYALDRGALDKAERDFESPRYVHLVRHPYAMVRSFEGYHMDQVLWMKEHDFSPRQLGELVWLVSQETILAFLETIPEERQCRVGFEQLVREPEPELQRICATFGIDYEPAMALPYQDLDRKMVDGIHDVSAPMGDTKLLQHGKVDPAVAESWRGVLEDDFLSERTWSVAEQLGYERPVAQKGAREAGRDDARDRGRRLSRGRQRRMQARAGREDG